MQTALDFLPKLISALPARSTVSSTSTPADSGKGPMEKLWLEKSGSQRMKVAAHEAGMSREEVAANRLAEMGEPTTLAATDTTLPEDDMGEVL